jgi:hypothetical protein
MHASTAMAPFVAAPLTTSNALPVVDVERWLQVRAMARSMGMPLIIRGAMSGWRALDALSPCYRAFLLMS